MVSLLDINVLIALAWPNHILHEPAHQWFGENHRSGWATCPLTQSGFVRVSSNRSIIPDARRPNEAIELLSRIIRQPDHVFWRDDISIAGSRYVAQDKIYGHRQVTDAHLLAVALSNKGRLATFDRRVIGLIPEGFTANETVIVLSR
jgi:toxin-antitoxin system PIN domain toxin